MLMGIDSELGAETRDINIAAKGGHIVSVPLNILTGMILGDASLVVSHGGRHAMLKLQHSPSQRSYLLHKVAILREITHVNVREVPDNGWGYGTIIAETRTHPIYTKLRKRWYPNGRKTISLQALMPLDAQGLAYWYMDDGSLTIHYRVLTSGRKSPKSREIHFHTQAFSREEHEIMREFLTERFGISTRISRHKGKYWVLGMGAKEGQKLFDIIRPYVLPMFDYKMNMHYVNAR